MKGPCRSISRADAGQGCELRAVRVILGVWGLRHGAPWGYGLGMDCGSTWMKRNPGEQIMLEEQILWGAWSWGMGCGHWKIL